MLCLRIFRTTLVYHSSYHITIFVCTVSFIILKSFLYTSENENLELNKNGGRSAMLQIFPRGRSAMKGGRFAILQTFPLGGRSAMLQIFRGKVCNVADLPGEGLQGGRSAIQHRLFMMFFKKILHLQKVRL